MKETDSEMFCPSSRKDWRQWLKKNHKIKTSVWLVYYKKNSNKPSLTWSEAVDEALCFGWIDSTARPIDDETYKQFFSVRKPKSVWSKINKEKVKTLIENELMTKSGYASIEVAKQNGSWTVLDEVEEFIIPKDLKQEFKTKHGSKEYFLTIPNSIRKAILQWLVLAKKLETRQNRIKEIVELASQQLRPKQFYPAKKSEKQK
jgi:uncharacterized protein YdeI (YjbR/CyaY-like superfamily)